MKHVIVTVLLLMLAVCAFAQEQYAYDWVKRVGSGSNDSVKALHVDSNGNIYSTGVIDFPSTFGSISIQSPNDHGIYISKQDCNGNFLWVAHAGNTIWNVYPQVGGYSITSDNDGNVYVTGSFLNSVTFGNITLTSSGRDDLFVAKLDSSGNWVWAISVTNSISSDYGDARGTGIVCSSDGFIYVTGRTTGETIFGTMHLTGQGSTDIFLAKLSSSGEWVNAIVAGGTNSDYSNAIDIDANNNVVIVGSYYSSQAVFGSNVLFHTAGSYSTFIAKFNSSLNCIWATSANHTSTSGFVDGRSVSFGADNSVYVTGCFKGMAAFGDSNLSSTALTAENAFFGKINSAGSWMWARQTTGSSSTWSYAVDSDNFGNMYAGGVFQGTATFGNVSITSSGNKDIFVAVYSPTGDFTYVKKGGSTYDEIAYSMEIASNYAIYVSGSVYGPTQFGGIMGSSIPPIGVGGNDDIFIAKLCPFSVDFSADITNVELGSSVSFTGIATGHPTSWAWDFNNDGIIDSNQQNPSKVYNSVGTYSVKLTATEDNLTSIVTTKVNYINVIHTNHAPTISDPISSIAFNEDTTYNLLNLSTHFIDVDLALGDHLTYNSVHSTNLNITITNGAVTIVPLANYFGSETVSFSATDDSLASVSTTVTVNVIAVNDPPVINLPASFTFAEDGNLSLNMASFVSDVDNTNLTVTTQSSSHIFVVMNGLNASITASPNWNGTETISFIVSDGQLNATAQRNVIVTPVNDAPVINLPASFTFVEDGTLSVNMASYVSDVDNTNLTVTSQNSAHINCSLNGLLATFTSASNWNGNELIGFTVSDGLLNASGQISVIVTQVNDAPVLNLPTSFTFAEDGTLMLNMALYASDVDNANLTLSASGNQNVTVNISNMNVALGALLNWNGVEQITFTINDNVTRLSASATTSIVVTPVNDPPVINLPSSFTFAEDGIITINMSNYVTDVDNADLTITATGNQNVTINISGMNVTLGALPNWNGTESITFTVNDNVSRDSFVVNQKTQNVRLTSLALTNVIVTPVNDSPVISLPTSFTFAEDGVLTIDLATYVSDVDNSNLTVTAQSSNHVFVTMSGMMASIITSANWNGAESVSFTVNDGLLLATTQTNIVVTPVNDAPVINIPTSFTFSEDNTLILGMCTYISDVDNTDLTITATGNQNVTIAINGTDITLGALPNWNGTEQIVFIVNDNVNKTIAIDTTNIIVTPVNDTPVITTFEPAQTTITVETNNSIDFSVNASDVDSDISYAWFVNNENQNISLDSFTYQCSESGTQQIKVVISDGQSSVEQIWNVTVPVSNNDVNSMPNVTKLYQNYPNPFNPETTIRYSLKNTGDVNLSIFNIRGQLIKVLKNCNLKAGDYTQTWNGLNDHNIPVSSGIYYIRMTTSSDVYIVKTILMK